MRGTGRISWTLAGLAVGAGAFAFLAWKTGFAAPIAIIEAVGPRAALLLVPYALATATYAVPWGLLLPKHARPRWAAIIGSRFAAAAVNVVIPSGFVGEPVRLRAVAPAVRALAGDALVWDRALYLTGSAAFMLVALACATHAGNTFNIAALTAVGGYLATALGLVGAARTPLLRRLLARFGASPAGGTRPAGSVALASIGLHFAGRMLHGSEIWVAAWLVGVTLSPGAWFVVAGAMFFTAAALPLVPGQVGVQEAAITGTLAMAGVDPSQGLAIALLLRLRQLAFLPIGFAVATSPLTAARATPVLERGHA